MGYAQDSDTADENHHGGPHPNGSPVLYADGSVRMYAYGATDASNPSFNNVKVFQALWAYDRGLNVLPPE